MRTKLTLAGAALALTLPTMAFAQTYIVPMETPPSPAAALGAAGELSEPNLPQRGDPDGYIIYEGRSSAVSPAAPLGAAGELREGDQ